MSIELHWKQNGIGLGVAVNAFGHQGLSLGIPQKASGQGKQILAAYNYRENRSLRKNGES